MAGGRNEFRNIRPDSVGRPLLLYLYRIPISFTLITLGVIFGYIGLGERVFHLMTYSFFGTMMDTVLAAVALFTFMGYLLESAGLMERLFHAIQLLSGHMRGSLYLATIFTATLFAAATGIVGASVTIIGLMAAPVMKRTGYDTGARGRSARAERWASHPSQRHARRHGTGVSGLSARLYAGAIRWLCSPFCKSPTRDQVMLNPELGPRSP
jgi:hypothetical protein